MTRPAAGAEPACRPGGETAVPWGRAVAVWLIAIAVEVVHGIARGSLLVPVVGERRARQIGVFSGSLLNFGVAYGFTRWLGAGGWQPLLRVGLLWSVLTLAFEIGFGRAVARASWSQIGEDYDPRRGGLLPLGLVALTVTPLAAARVRCAIGSVRGGSIPPK